MTLPPPGASPVSQTIVIPPEFWEHSAYADNTYVSKPFDEAMLASVQAELGYTLPATCGNCPHVWRLQDDPKAIERLKQRFRDDPEFAESLLPNFSDEDRQKAFGPND